MSIPIHKTHHRHEIDDTVYSGFGLDGFSVYPVFGLDRFSVYSGFALDRISVYSGFALDRFSVYSGFGLDSFTVLFIFHCIAYFMSVMCFVYWYTVLIWYLSNRKIVEKAEIDTLTHIATHFSSLVHVLK
jgi:hypothetical protein